MKKTNPPASQQERAGEIRELQKVIFRDAFKSESFAYPVNPESEKPEAPNDEVEIPTHIYVFREGERRTEKIGCRKDMGGFQHEKKERDNKIIPVVVGLDVPALSDLHELLIKMQGFTRDLSETIWALKQDAKPEAGERMLQTGKERLLAETKRSLQKSYSGRAIKKTMKILENDLKERWDKFKDTRKYNYFTMKSPLSQFWIDRENESIAKIRNLYKKYFDPLLSDRSMISSMAIIFAATDFWTKHKDEEEKRRIGLYFEVLKKRLSTIQDEQSVEVKLIDPPYFPTE